MKADSKNTRYFYLKKGLDAETVIFQYMDLDYLLCLLEKNEYFINRKSTFEDKREKELPIRSIFSFQAVGGEVSVPKQIDNDVDATLKKMEIFKELKHLPTSCWTKGSLANKSEDILMWKSFTCKIGACIKSTIHNFISSFKTNEYEIWCGDIAYNSFSPSQTLIESLYTKEQAFYSEQEIRFYFASENDNSNCSNHISLNVNPLVMIDEIILSPFITQIASAKLAEIIKRTYNIKTLSSNIQIH